MVQTEKNEDIERLFREGVSEAPNIAINLCIGVDGEFAIGHHLFIVMKRTTNGKYLWEENNLAEFDNLDKALLYPNAQPYGSSTLCSACEELLHLSMKK